MFDIKPSCDHVCTFEQLRREGQDPKAIFEEVFRAALEIVGSRSCQHAALCSRTLCREPVGPIYFAPSLIALWR